jgi:hypothetical protein
MLRTDGGIQFKVIYDLRITTGCQGIRQNQSAGQETLIDIKEITAMTGMTGRGGYHTAQWLLVAWMLFSELTRVSQKLVVRTIIVSFPGISNRPSFELSRILNFNLAGAGTELSKN